MNAFKTKHALIDLLKPSYKISDLNENFWPILGFLYNNFASKQKSFFENFLIIIWINCIMGRIFIGTKIDFLLYKLKPNFTFIIYTVMNNFGFYPFNTYMLALDKAILFILFIATLHFFQRMYTDWNCSLGKIWFISVLKFGFS